MLTYYKTLRLENTKFRIIRSSFCNSKWFSQQPLLSEKQREEKIGTYFNCDFSSWCWEVGEVREAWSWGWSSCWDETDGVVFIVVAVLMMMIMMILFLKQNDRIREVRIAAYIFTIGAKYRSKMQSIWRAISFHIQLPIFALNLHVKNTLSHLRYFALETNHTFLRYL